MVSGESFIEIEDLIHEVVALGQKPLATSTTSGNDRVTKNRKGNKFCRKLYPGDAGCDGELADCKFLPIVSACLKVRIT